jgi:hypothetical protein
MYVNASICMSVLHRSTRRLWIPKIPPTMACFTASQSAVKNPLLKMPKSTSRTSPQHHFLSLVSYQHDPNQAYRLLESRHLKVRRLDILVSTHVDLGPGCLPSVRYVGLVYELLLTTANLIFSKFFPLIPVRFSSRFLVSENFSPYS